MFHTAHPMYLFRKEFTTLAEPPDQLAQEPGRKRELQGIVDPSDPAPHRRIIGLVMVMPA